MSWFSKFISFLKGLVTRPGLDKFLSKYLPVATNLLLDLAKINSNAAFHVWKDKAFNELKAITGEVRDTWIAILLNIAFETLKAKGKL